MKTTKHSLNGKFIGCFYELEDGETLYLSHNTMREKWDDCWWFDQFTLRKCAELNCPLGVIVKNKGIWLVNYAEFDASEFKVKRNRNGMQLFGLPLAVFPVNPLKNVARIAKEITIRAPRK